ncbi:MAG TPA: hypothetical protein VGD53_23330 [Actinoallomurus sp.]
MANVFDVLRKDHVEVMGALDEPDSGVRRTRTCSRYARSSSST